MVELTKKAGNKTLLLLLDDTANEINVDLHGKFDF